MYQVLKHSLYTRKDYKSNEIQKFQTKPILISEARIQQFNGIYVEFFFIKIIIGQPYLHTY